MYLSSDQIWLALIVIGLACGFLGFLFGGWSERNKT